MDRHPEARGGRWGLGEQSPPSPKGGLAGIHPGGIGDERGGGPSELRQDRRLWWAFAAYRPTRLVVPHHKTHDNSGPWRASITSVLLQRPFAHGEDSAFSLGSTPPSLYGGMSVSYVVDYQAEKHMWRRGRLAYVRLDWTVW